MRLDRWLWAVRLYKSRSLATDAIKAGHVKVNGDPIKPAHEARPGSLVAARIGVMTRSFRVLAAPPSRVGAKLVADFAEDLTPPEEWEKQRMNAALQPAFRERGSGRPTKRERRTLEQLDQKVWERSPAAEE